MEEYLLLTIAVDAVALAVVAAVAIMLYRGRRVKVSGSVAMEHEVKEGYSVEAGLSEIRQQLKGLKSSMDSLDKSVDNAGRSVKRVAHDRRRS